MNNAVKIKDGKVFFVKESEKGKSHVSDTETLKESIREVVQEEMKKSQKNELDEMLESLNGIENQGGGGTCIVHSTTKVSKNIDDVF